MARRKQLPLDPFEADISTLHPSGAGLTVHDGQTLRVHGALAGERVEACYLLGRRLRGQARTHAVLQPSLQRVTARCPHFGTCGACALQHVDPAAQAAFKQGQLEQWLSQHQLVPGQWLAPLQAGTWNYRRKARMSVRYVKARERVLVGFRERDGRFVTDTRECHILHPLAARHLASLAEMIGELECRESLPQVEVSCGDRQCAMILRHLEPLSRADLEKLAQFEQQTGLLLYLQPKGPDTVVALNPSSPALRYDLPEYGLSYAFEPLDFVQVNGELNQLMVRQAIKWLDLQPQQRVLDLFCGLGNFTLPLARQCAEAIGLEGAESLVRRAQTIALANRVNNVRFLQADLYSGDLEPAWPEGQFDRVLLDPPRSGAGPVLEKIAHSGAGRVVYVSCNPETLAQDCAVLTVELGYRLLAAGVMDMFPHTAHIESMAVLERA